VTHQARNSVQDQVERWGAEARKLVESGREAAALEVYRRAADALPGAPWLQHRTAELARKLRQSDVAISYFRRAAVAFVGAGFERRAIPPLTSAWTLARAGLPSTGAVLPRVAEELAELLRSLGLATDAAVTLEYTEDALRRVGLPYAELQSPQRASGIDSTREDPGRSTGTK
jgi:tetratricopeptide (TPR) repeat protein